MKISEIGEQALIKEIAALVASTADRDGVGIGDDAALARFADGAYVATSKDMLVEGVHFLLPGITAQDLGFKALAANLSDLAAMGARPRHAFVALALPAGTECEFVLDFFRGMMQLAEKYGIAVSGGDLVASPGPLAVSVTVQGEVRREQALLRRGARPGELICTTGSLGASAAGLTLLLQDMPCDDKVRAAALKAHFRPEPRVREGIWLAKSGAVTAAMDISDGLLKDIREIMEVNGCGALFYEEKIPVDPVARAVAAAAGRLPLDFALHGGEDYELLFTVPENAFEGLSGAYLAHFGRPLYALGRLTEEMRLQMVTKDGKWEELEFAGYRHF
ncbi:MAG: thiamine-phosphate kinase [Firmicutes bacterium]|nr:thiamine-phosphate kinase [Bacillota bacterium]